jgi:uncharacterized protein (DUF58 family)
MNREIKNTSTVVRGIMDLVEGVAITINWRSEFMLRATSGRRSHTRGLGKEILSRRPFVNGDNLKDVDWHATARSGKDDEFIVKVFEREPIVVLRIVQDVSEPMRMSGKSFLASVCTGCVVESAKRTNDLVAFVTVDRKAKTVLDLGSAAGIQLDVLAASVRDSQQTAVPPTFSLRSWGRRGLRLRQWPAQILKRLTNLWQRLREAAQPSVWRQKWNGLWRSVSSLPGQMWHLMPWGQETVERAGEDGGGLAIGLAASFFADYTLTVIISDFVKVSPRDWKALRNVEPDTIAVFVQAPRERELPKAPWPGMSYRVQDVFGQEVSLWILPDNGLLPWIGKLLAPARRLLAPLLQMLSPTIGPTLDLVFGKPFQWLFGRVTTREQWRENFRQHEAAILRQLRACGIQPLIVQTDEVEEAIRKLLLLLAETRG